MCRVLGTCLFLVLLLATLPLNAAKLICVDPGHGGDDPGAVGCGLEEEDITLDVAQRLKALLDSDPDLAGILTRSSDVSVSLGARCDYANDNGADRFASIHCNAYNGSATGIETYCYSGGSAASFDQRNRIQDKMTAIWPDLLDRGVKTAGYYVIKYTDMPATLSELAFIDNCGNDAKYLAKPEQRQAAAVAHHKALRESLGLPPISSDPGPTPDPDPVEPDPQPGTALLRGAVYEDKGVGTADMSVRLVGAVVTATANGKTLTTSAQSPDGLWVLDLQVGSYTVTASKAGYYDNTRVCEVLAGGDNWCSIGLTKKPADAPVAKASLQGVVYQDKGQGDKDMSKRLKGAVVSLFGTDGFASTLTAKGSEALWSIEVSPGTYTVSAFYTGYWPNTRTCQVVSGVENWCSIGLFKKQTQPPPTPTGETGKLVGTVFKVIGHDETDMSVRLPGATVKATAGGIVQFAQAPQPDAVWKIELPPGVYEVTAVLDGYWPTVRTCSVGVGTEVWCSLGMISLTAEEAPDGNGPDGGKDKTVETADPAAEGGNTLVVDGPPESETGSGCTQARHASPASGLLLLALLAAGLLLRGLRSRGALAGRAHPVRVTAAGNALLLAAAMALCAGPARGQEAACDGQWKLSNVVKVTAHRDFQQPVWSPDGARLAFTDEKAATLLVVDAAGGEPRVLATGKSAGLAPQWAADGASLAYRAPGQRQSDVPLLSVRLDGLRGPVPTPRVAGRWLVIAEDVVWSATGQGSTRLSPEGDRFCCAVEGPGDLVAFLGLESGLTVAHRGTGERISVGRGNHPAFSPDGSLLMFDACEDDGNDLTRCSLALTQLSQDAATTAIVQDTPLLARTPAFAPDGKHVAFSALGAIYTAELVCSGR